MTSAAAYPYYFFSKSCLHHMLLRSCAELKDTTTDFFVKYHAMHHLRSTAESNPAMIDDGTLHLIQEIFKDKRFTDQRQSLFFFRQAAEVFTTLMIHSNDRGSAARTIAALSEVIRTTTGNGHRAAVEALGSLPVTIRGPQLNPYTCDDILPISWRDLLRLGQVSLARPPELLGRSLIGPVTDSRRLLVVKVARASDRAAPGRDSFSPP